MNINERTVILDQDKFTAAYSLLGITSYLKIMFRWNLQDDSLRSVFARWWASFFCVINEPTSKLWGISGDERLYIPLFRFVLLKTKTRLMTRSRVSHSPKSLVKHFHLLKQKQKILLIIYTRCHQCCAVMTGEFFMTGYTRPQTTRLPLILHVFKANRRTHLTKNCNFFFSSSGFGCERWGWYWHWYQ